MVESFSPVVIEDNVCLHYYNTAFFHKQKWFFDSCSIVTNRKCWMNKPIFFEHKITICCWWFLRFSSLPSSDYNYYKLFFWKSGIRVDNSIYREQSMIIHPCAYHIWVVGGDVPYNTTNLDEKKCPLLPLLPLLPLAINI